MGTKLYLTFLYGRNEKTSGEIFYYCLDTQRYPRGILKEKSVAIFHNYTAFCFQISCMICFIWTAGIILSVMPLSGISSYVSESYLLVCEFNTWSKDSVDRGYIYFLILTAWFMPVCIIFYCYTKVIWMKFSWEKSLEKSLIFFRFFYTPPEQDHQWKTSKIQMLPIVTEAVLPPAILSKTYSTQIYLWWKEN